MIKIRHLLFIISTLLFTTNITAQNLVAYHVVGDVTYVAQGNTKKLVMNTNITNETTVNIPYGCKVELLDEKNQKRITLKKPGKGTVKALCSEQENSVIELSSKYVAYVKKQLTNKNLTSKQRYTDFATVTREVDSVAVAKPKKKSAFQSSFDGFVKDSKKTMNDFRSECNRTYNDFVRKAWEEFGAEPPKLLPEEPRVDPVVYENSQETAGFLSFGRHKKTPKKVESMPDVLVKRETQPAPIQQIKEVETNIIDREFAKMPFIFFGNELEVRLDETRRINVGEISPNRVADILDRLCTSEYDNLLFDCLALRKQYNMCDWAYLQMLKEITDQFCGVGTNEAAVLMGYLYYQSGYKMRFATDNKQLYLLIASKHTIYGKSAYKVGDEIFYPLDEISVPVLICKAEFPKEQGLSLFISNPQAFSTTEVEERTVTSERFPDFGFKVRVNRSLMDFYDIYPTSCLNGDFTTRWLVNASTPLDNNIKNQIYPTLKQKLEGLSEYDAVSRLLNLVQTGFEYKYDEEVWGYDRAFFAEETLNYPFCDCEDRSILLTRLIRDLLGLECALVYYPGHLAAAVHFTNEVNGDYYEVNGKDYVVCDPTYINADIGMQMPSFVNGGATLIPLN